MATTASEKISGARRSGHRFWRRGARYGWNATVLQSLWQQRASPMRHVFANEIHLHLGCSHVDF
jgi:hypothetical protein